MPTINKNNQPQTIQKIEKLVRFTKELYQDEKENQIHVVGVMQLTQIIKNPNSKLFTCTL